MVGGGAESGYAPVGYLFTSAVPEYKSICGVTLIAPSVVVTAAHCMETYDATTFSVGFGAVGSGRTIAVKASHISPTYARNDADPASTSSWNDFAVLELASAVTDIKPAAIATAETGGCVHRYVGYGRNTEGDGTVQTGYDSQRKSAVICLDGQTSHELLIHGSDGGLCWGDSGGPLLVNGTTKILGVLSRHAARAAGASYSCENGNRMVFTALATYRDFIAQFAPDAFEPDPAPPKTNVGWCNVQWPAAVHASLLAPSDVVYGRAWIDGVTQGQGQGAGVLAEVGFGPRGSADGWTWYAAQYNVDADGLTPGDRANDEYKGTLFSWNVGTYGVAYRFSLDHGHTYTSCSSNTVLTVE